ncbi:hypothetical protein O7614_01880 [Micromonospora sp. WMMD961]|uniref:hypothetical protein n=1 Tax=Micromonospora sp. WMMD961 TaxID=3016100 RepID=UPI0024173C10|nr:hypothetical protein [Micromonospora sp. WMMD961]MDG4778395.1 hypothetical protein [Micromonospora sp. WMMD961]
MGRAGLAVTWGMSAVGESATDGVEEPDGTARLGLPEAGLVGAPPGAAEPLGPGVPPVVAGRVASAPGVAGRLTAAPGVAGRPAPGVTGPAGIAPGVAGRVGAAPGVAGRVGAAPGVLGSPVGAALDQGGRVGALSGVAGRTGPWFAGAAGTPGVGATGGPEPACGPSP